MPIERSSGFVLQAQTNNQATRQNGPNRLQRLFNGLTRLPAALRRPNLAGTLNGMRSPTIEPFMQRERITPNPEARRARLPHGAVSIPVPANRYNVRTHSIISRPITPAVYEDRSPLLTPFEIRNQTNTEDHWQPLDGQCSLPIATAVDDRVTEIAQATRASAGEIQNLRTVDIVGFALKEEPPTIHRETAAQLLEISDMSKEVFFTDVKFQERVVSLATNERFGPMVNNDAINKIHHFLQDELAACQTGDRSKVLSNNMYGDHITLRLSNDSRFSPEIQTLAREINGQIDDDVKNDV